MMTIDPSLPNAFLRCQTCSAQHELSQPIWRCPCGGLLDVEMEPAFPWAAMQTRPPGLWRYRDAIPVRGRPVSLGEPQTPLVEMAGARCQLLLKLDHLFPTGSFKDRGATVLLTKIKELGVSAIVEDSSGNAGAAIAAYAASAAISATIYVPANASQVKTAPIQLYGANLVRVPGSRSDTSRVTWQEAQRTYYASHVWNPFFVEGTKTIAFELWDQLGQQVPDWVIAPVGHGTLLLGLYRGFHHLVAAGVTHRLPRIVGVQASACSPLVQAFQGGLDHLPQMEAEETQADGIAISHPLRWRQILQAVKDTAGTMIAVNEVKIRQALLYWAGRGLLMEPTSAVALAALLDLCEDGTVGWSDRVVVPITGAGIKTASQYLAPVGIA